MSDSPYIFEVNEENFNHIVLENSKKVPVLVDFWAAWCGPCQMLMPLLAKLVNEYQGAFLLAKINTDEQSNLAAQWGVRSLPTVKIFRNANVVNEFMGVQPEGQIRAMIENYVERESDKICAQALDLYEQGQSEQAIELLYKAVEMEPQNQQIPIELTNILMTEGKYDQADKILSTLPANIQTEPEVAALMARLDFARTAQNTPSIDDLKTTVASDPANNDARYQLSAKYILNGEYDPAMEQLIEILRRDRRYGDDAARKGLLKIFEMLGNQGELVSRYRTEMFKIMH
jgi:putative thioredoxin